MKKSNFKVIAEATEFKKLNKFEPNLKRLDCRKMTIDEIKELVKEEFGKVKDSADTEAKEGHWRGYGIRERN